MRHLATALVLMVVGCAAGCADRALAPEPAGPVDMAHKVDAGAVDQGHVDHGHPVVDLRAADLASHDLAGGCVTACDCESGLACVGGTCTAVPDFQLFCCDLSSTQCPMGQACESSSGEVGTCGGPTFPIPIQQLCGFIPCQDSSVCKLVGCGSCGNSGTCNTPGG